MQHMLQYLVILMKNEEISKTIKESAKLETSPVAIKLFEKETDAKKYLEKSDKIIHCQAVITSTKGKSFYATSDELGCPVACEIMGLKEMKTLSGEYFDKNNVTKTLKAGENLYSTVPKLNMKIEAVGYAPLENAEFTPDVIAVVGKPKQIYNLIRAHVYENGERLENSVSGTQSFCGDIVIKTLQTGTVSLSYGCIGSHMATDFGEDEIVCGIPYSKLEALTENLKIVKLPK